MKNSSVILTLVSALLAQNSLMAQGRRGGPGAGAAPPPGSSPEQQAAIVSMEQEAAPLLQAETTARAAVLAATFAEPGGDANLRARLDELKSAELAVAAARADFFSKFQEGETKFNAAQVQSLVAAQLGGGSAQGARGAPAAAPRAGAPAGNRGGRGGGRGAGGGVPNGNRLAGEEVLPPAMSLQARVRQLDGMLGSATALEEAKKTAMDASASIEARKSAFQVVVNRGDPAVRPMAEQLLTVSGVNPVAASALSTIDAPEIGPMLVAAYPQFLAADRPQLVAALVARKTTAKALLDAVADGKIPRSAVPASAAQQIVGFNDDALTQQVSKVWGNLRPSNAEKTELLAKVKADLTPENLAKASRNEGRLVFKNTCAVCHTIFGEGGNIGPDLTGSARGNLEYVLTSIADPSAVVAKDFTVTTINLKDERSVSGVIASEDARVLALKTTTGIVPVQKSDILSRSQSELSMMPDGLFQALKPEQIRNLIAYLLSPEQVPLPTP